MDHTPESLEHYSQENAPAEKQEYTPRPKSHIILAWIGIAIVLFAFFGTCYWMVNY
ncbi:MAG: hypothetical protein ACI4PT_11640 [Candidatus Avoscillospira sp.]